MSSEAKRWVVTKRKRGFSLGAGGGAWIKVTPTVYGQKQSVPKPGEELVPYGPRSGIGGVPK